MLGFVAKGMNFEIRNLEASKREHKTADFLALILSYLDKLHPEPPLFGTTAEEHARIWQLVSECEHYCRPGNNALLGPIFRGQNDTNEEVRNAATTVHEEFKRLEKVLERSRFLCGERMTAADCVCFPEVRLVLRATERFPEIMQRLEFHSFDKAYPRLNAWAVRIEALPGYEKTYPPHWRSS
jgi:glutathione S-transferase